MKFKWTMFWKFVLSLKRFPYRLMKVGNIYYLSLLIPAWLLISMYSSIWRTQRSEYLPGGVTQRLSKQSEDSGCKFPNVDPFSEVAMKYEKTMPKVTCNEVDWVECNMSECRVTDHILSTTSDVVCHYKDIIYINDHEYVVADPVTLYGDAVYRLNRSDGFRVSCTGYNSNWISLLSKRWYGYKAGIRPIKSNRSNENTINVLIVGFDSASHNAFIRRMPKSLKYLKDEMEAVILNGYNIVGDGTPDALFPILSGRTELQHPYAKIRYSKNIYLDPDLFIFHIAKTHGYETAYFEDMPWVGTFQYRYNGFKRRPADHYMRSFFTEESKIGKKWFSNYNSKYCLGGTPQYLFLLNMTRQFMNVKTKRFCFTFIGDICHDNFNMISTADEDLVEFLKHVKSNLLNDTLVIVMGDHGQRFTAIRNTYQGKIEERMAFMSFILPEKLKRDRPDALHFLKQNARVLTTPFDIHTTLLDAMGLKKYASEYIAPHSVNIRGLSLLEPIPVHRMCEDAGILPFWCVCTNVVWKDVPQDDPNYAAAGQALLLYVNDVIAEIRELCVERTLRSIQWVIVHEKVDARIGAVFKMYQAAIFTNPGEGIFEGLMGYDNHTGLFTIPTDNSVSRISAYGTEPACISNTHPQFNKYCYCK